MEKGKSYVKVNQQGPPAVGSPNAAEEGIMGNQPALVLGTVPRLSQECFITLPAEEGSDPQECPA